MAKAIHNKKKIELVEKVVAEESFTITLSKEEALAVFSVLGKITGDPCGPVRLQTAKVYAALLSAGIRNTDGSKYRNDIVTAPATAAPKKPAPDPLVDTWIGSSYLDRDFFYVSR